MSTSEGIQRSQQTAVNPQTTETNNQHRGHNVPVSGLFPTSYIFPPAGFLNAYQQQLESRRDSGNFPDIVDSDICFLPTSSEIDLSQRMETQNNASHSGSGASIPPPTLTVTAPASTTSPRTSSSSNSGFVNEHRRSISAIIDQQLLDQNNSDIRTESDTTGAGPTVLPIPPPGGVAGATHISTQDLNVGVSRVNPHHEALPDLLNSHVIPSHLLPAGGRHGHPQRPPNMDHHVYANYHGHPRHNQRHRHHDGHRNGRRPHRSRSRSGSQSSNDLCKENCMSCLAAVTSFRWILVVLSLLGVCCVVTGIVLAALHAAGNSFLFLAIMFIGLGILLVVVVAVGWKCTPRGHEPLHALFGLGDFRHHGQPRERRSRHHRHRRREGHWYGGVMYPEFQYRRPPPSYNASMQEFQQQLAIAQSYRTFNDEFTPAEDYSLPSSPPPSYRSRASTVRTGIQITFPPSRSDQPNSRPPTYRSHVGGDGHSRPSLPREEDGGAEVENVVLTSSANSNNATGNVTDARSSEEAQQNSLSPQHLPLGASASTSANDGATNITVTVRSSTENSVGTHDTLEDAASPPPHNSAPSPDYHQEGDGEYPMLTQL